MQTSPVNQTIQIQPPSVAQNLKSRITFLATRLSKLAQQFANFGTVVFRPPITRSLALSALGTSIFGVY